MTLRTLLQELTIDDAQAAAVGSMDGRVVHAIIKDLEADLGRLGPDLAALLKVGAYCARKLEGGEVEFVTLATDRLALLVVALTSDHFLVVVLRAGGNVARARLAIKKRRSELVELLT
jgi:predicted regulator of Ras-like GTPase activity (Roadblock/LC7/MglB family)